MTSKKFDKVFVKVYYEVILDNAKHPSVPSISNQFKPHDIY